MTTPHLALGGGEDWGAGEQLTWSSVTVHYRLYHWLVGQQQKLGVQQPSQSQECVKALVAQRLSQMVEAATEEWFVSLQLYSQGLQLESQASTQTSPHRKIINPMADSDQEEVSEGRHQPGGLSQPPLSTKSDGPAGPWSGRPLLPWCIQNILLVAPS